MNVVSQLLFSMESLTYAHKSNKLVPKLITIKH